MEFKEVIKMLMSDDRNATWDEIETEEELKNDLEVCIEHHEELGDEEEVEYFKKMLDLLK